MARRSRGSAWARILVLAALAPAWLACLPRGGPVPRPEAPAGIPAGRVPPAWPIPRDEPPATAPRAMVASGEDLATRVGVETLRGGGNAADAAVAVALSLAVVHPRAGNLGGGGFAVVRTARGDAAALDFRETAPLAATRTMFSGDDEGPMRRSWTGHLASGVPGTVAGLGEIHRRYGRLSWVEVVEPAARLAREGFAVPADFAASLAEEKERLLRFPASADLFLPEGAPPPAGSRWSTPALAATLARIAARGAEEFYRGETAGRIVAEMERGGGLITSEDLRRYRARWRKPVRFRYRGHTVFSAPPPSSGGLVLALIAGILEPYDLAAPGWHSAAAVHLTSEAMRRAFAERDRWLGDPDFVRIPAGRFLDPGFAAVQRRTIAPDRASPDAARPETGGEASAERPGAIAAAASTTHVSVIDPEGNAVALTTTVNGAYGSAVTVAGAGFLLNNEMDDFTVRPGSANEYGLIQGEANAIAPGKRMLSSMAPTIVLDPDGGVLMVTGAAGGSRILTSVFQILSHVIDYGIRSAQAVDAPRFHHQRLPDRIAYEPDGFPPDLIAALEAMGHRVEPFEGIIGVAPTVIRAGDLWVGTGDPHRRAGGSARGF